MVSKLFAQVEGHFWLTVKKLLVGYAVINLHFKLSGIDSRIWS